jgi:hypothetical protein
MKKALASNTFLYFLAATLVLCALLGRVMARTTLVRLGYELSAAEEDHQKLVGDLQALRTEFAARRSPDRLLRDGKKSFHLEPARAEQIFTMKVMP